MINFPNAPVEDETLTVDDRTWVWKNGKWTFNPFVPNPIPLQVQKPAPLQKPIVKSSPTKKKWKI